MRAGKGFYVSIRVVKEDVEEAACMYANVLQWSRLPTRLRREIL